MKITWRFVLGAFLITTFFIAPFLNNKSGEVAKKNVISLNQNLDSKNDTIQTQNATIQSDDAEIRRLNQKLSDIESENDVSAKSVKKRVLNLAQQISEFWLQSQTNSLYDSPNFLEIAKKVFPTNPEVWFNWQFLQTNTDALIEYHKESDASEAEYENKSTKVQYEFDMRFAGRIASERDELANLGLTSNKLDSRIESELTYLSAPRIAQDLTELANKITDDGEVLK